VTVPPNGLLKQKPSLPEFDDKSKHQVPLKRSDAGDVPERFEA
jgi:hypothetical protein